jgi:cytochrome c biogenesis protein ResB
MRGLSKLFIDVFSSIWLSIGLLVLIGVATFLGTLDQVDEGLFRAQAKYFDSFFYVQSFGPFALPLPGGMTLMSLLFVNLVVGGIVRMKRTWSRLGILINHVGIGMLLLAGLVRFAAADEGVIMLREGDTANEFRSHHLVEVAILVPRGDGTLREYLIPNRWVTAAGDDREFTFRHPDLPFDLVLSHFTVNAQVMPKGPMFEVSVPVVDGYFVRELPEVDEHERNRQACYAEVVWKDGREPQRGILSLLTQPWTVGSADSPYAIELRKKRFSLPFEVLLKRTHQEFHPGTRKPKEFWSEVRMTDGAFVRDWKIEMNRPLRHRGFVVYQSQWDEDPSGRYSGLAVARNPSDQWPLWSCVVIAIGLILHFGRMMLRYMRNELRSQS